MRLSTIGTLVLSLSLGSCASGPQLDPEVIVDRRVDRIVLSFSALAENYIIGQVIFHMQDPGLSTHERIRLTFESSTGDREEVLGPANTFLVTLKPGHTPDEYADRISAINGVIRSRFANNRGMAIMILRSDIPRDDAYNAISRWENVEAVELDFAVDIFIRPYWTGVPIPLTSAGQSGDFQLRAQSGDTVRAIYHNAVGPPVRVSAVIP
ncbi:MAG: hypothetical protein ACYC2K_03665 [Gemmatimonadales bacterium]